MNYIKNIHYLEDMLSDNKLEELEHGGQQYRRHVNITFKVQKATEDELVVEVRQGRNSLDRYLEPAELIDRAKDLFSRFFPDHSIHVRPKPYQSPPPDDVTPKWVSDRMNQTGIGIKDLVKSTGIDRTNLSAWVNGKRRMSQPVKAMFYWFFAGKKKEEEKALK